MTADELRVQFNTMFMYDDWPATFEVDAETYGNVCQAIFNNLWDTQDMYWGKIVEGVVKSPEKIVGVSLGLNKGIMFKNVELILVNTHTK